MLEIRDFSVKMLLRNNQLRYFFSRAPITSSLMDVSEHPAYFAYVIRHLDEDGDGMISSDEMNNALN